MASEPPTSPASPPPAGSSIPAGDTAVPPIPPAESPITPGDFFRADIRVGTIVRAEPFPQARKPAYRLWIDFGELGIRTSSAQITALYEPASLTGRLVLAVVNFPPRRIAGFASEVLVLGVPAGSGSAEEAARTIALIAPDREVPPGTRVF